MGGRELYRSRYIYEITLKDGSIVKDYGDCGRILYKKVSEDEVLLTDWSDLLDKLGYIKGFNGNRTWKGRVWVRFFYTDEEYNEGCRRIYQDEFVSMKVHHDVSIIKRDVERFKHLVDELPINEFIDFMKDNGISYMSDL